MLISKTSTFLSLVFWISLPFSNQGRLPLVLYVTQRLRGRDLRGQMPKCRFSPENHRLSQIHLFLGNENSAQSFSDRSFWKSLRVVDVRAFGSWMSATTCLFFQDFERPDRSISARMTPGSPWDIRPKNLLFGLILRSRLLSLLLEHESFRDDFPP